MVCVMQRSRWLPQGVGDHLVRENALKKIESKTLQKKKCCRQHLGRPGFWLLNVI